MPYHTIPYHTIPYYTILYYTILYYTILYYTILYYTILYYTILYYTNSTIRIILYDTSFTTFASAVRQLPAKSRRHQPCHFRIRATSVPAEGPAYGLDFARRCEFSLRALHAQKWRVHGSRMFGAACEKQKGGAALCRERARATCCDDDDDDNGDGQSDVRTLFREDAELSPMASTAGCCNFDSTAQ